MLLKCFNFWSQYLIFYVILEKNQQLVFTYLKSVFFNGLSILYVNKHVLWLMVRQFTPNTYYCSGYFYSISVETCSSKIRGQKRVLNTFCCHGWEMWHHFINGQRAGSEMWGGGAPWLWEMGNGNSQEWLSHGPSLGLLLSSRASLPSWDQGHWDKPSFYKGWSSGRTDEALFFHRMSQPLFPNAGKVIWAVMMSMLWLQAWLVCVLIWF